MSNIILRPAELADRKALCDLYHEFHEFHARGVPDRLVSEVGYPDRCDEKGLLQALENIIRSENSTIIVAEEDGRIVGLAEIYIRDDTPDPLQKSYRFGYLQSLLVTERCRRQGTGERLLAAAEQWALAKGAAEIRLDIWEFDAGPLKFYEKCGYKTLRRSMTRKLDIHTHRDQKQVVDVVEVARRFVDAINSHDVEALAALMTEDHRFIDSMGTIVNGRANMKQGWIGYYKLVPDYGINIAETFSTGSTVVFIGKAFGTYTSDGKLKPENRWEAVAAWRAVVEDEKICEWQVIADLESIRMIIRKEIR